MRNRASETDLVDRNGRAGFVVALPRPETGRAEGAVLAVLAAAAIFAVVVFFAGLGRVVDQAPRIVRQVDGFRPTFVKHVLVSMPSRRPTTVPPETSATIGPKAAPLPEPAG